MRSDSVIIMSKHQSAWETMALRTIIGGNQSWILKRELMWVPVFGWALAFMQPIAINRKAGRKSVEQIVKQGTKYLKQGNAVIVFPEGTRTEPGKSGRYKLGGAILAAESGYPIVPVAHNAGIFWRRREINKYPGIIDVVIGETIPTKGRKAEEIIKDVEHWIESTIKTLPQARETA